MDSSAIQAAKTAVIHATGLSKDALHISVGLAIFFLVAFIARRRSNSVVPLAAVIVTAIAGEVVDMRDDLGSLGMWRWNASLHDLLVTIAWPLTITLLVRSGLFAPRTTK